MFHEVVHSSPLQFAQVLKCCGDLMVDLQACDLPTACEDFARNWGDDVFRNAHEVSVDQLNF